MARPHPKNQKRNRFCKRIQKRRKRHKKFPRRNKYLPKRSTILNFKRNFNQFGNIQ